MTHVALTCPRLLFTLGFELHVRPGQLDELGDFARELEAHGSVRRGHKSFVVELVDSQDALLGLQILQQRHDVTVMSIVGSADAAALCMLVEPAWAAITEELVMPEADEWNPPLTFARGIAAARHFRPLRCYPPPDAIADAKLPEAPLVLWSVADGELVAIDAPFEIGPLRFEPRGDGWRVGSAVTVNGQRADTVELAPGMVIQRAVPEAYVVLR